MSIAISAGTAALIGGLASAGAGIAGSVIGSKAAGKAGDVGVAAANESIPEIQAAGDRATTLQAGGATAANQTLNAAQLQRMEALKPYIDAGVLSMADLQKILGEEGSLAKDKFSFTAKDWQNDPGFAYMVEQQQRAAQNAAAQAGGWTGGFSKGLNRNIAGLTSTYLDQGFNRALQTYDTNRQNTLLRIQGLQGLTGLGYNATGTQDAVIGNTQGQVAQNQLNTGLYAGDTALRTAENVATIRGQGANSQAAGIVGRANAWQQGLGTVANAAMGTAALYSMPQLTVPAPRPTITPVPMSPIPTPTGLLYDQGVRR